MGYGQWRKIKGRKKGTSSLRSLPCWRVPGGRRAFLRPHPMTVDQTPMPCSWKLNDVNETERNETIPYQGSRADAKALPIIIPYLTVLISLVGLVGNGIVLWLLGFRIKRNPFSVYILNLAGADFVFLSCQVLAPITFSSYTMDLSVLAAISTERCLSVLFPVWYRCQRPKHTSTLVCALLWIESVMISVLTGDGCGFFYRKYSKQACYDFTIASAVLVFSLFFLTCVSSLTLFLRVQGNSRRRRSPKIYIVILCTVLMFLLLGLPFSIYWFLLSWWEDTFLKDWNLPYFIIDTLSCANSTINPFIYFFVGSFRQQKSWEPFRVVLQRALQDEAELREEGEISHPEIMKLSACDCQKGEGEM
ncbi:mas-related G-protein coupled receptor member A-like isoform X2 [Phascolarctos cinereus]|uniref:Mas-related G-protein coupled receptor member A-like isoform X2 n=1 Tax=Phascolarctos cinereus TaxID=38626 RepID=A0A6P5J5M7_PHACI|nr:mas-related G-protein coupled receptor member A-like isoform X2 [Phascolarctos cinereus]